MSSPGYFYGQDDPQYAAQNQMMAKILMGNQNPQQQTQPFGGIGQAIALKALQNRQAEQAYNKQAPTTANLTLPGMDGQTMQSTLSAGKLPYMGPKGLSGLFNFGGG